MDSALVIKVKYGDTLRRFSVYVDENGLLDLDLAGLKMKIHSLFIFPHDADLILTYIDEDKDEVTLVDDNDLCDATRQNLNPLRISVMLNSTTAGRSESKLIESSAPNILAKVEHLSSHTDSTFDEVLKSAHEPILEVFSKLSHELTTKATSLILTKLVEYLSKLELSDLSLDGASLSGEKSASECSMCTKVTEDLELPKLNTLDSIPTDFEKVLETGYKDKPMGSSIPPITSLVELNVDRPMVSTASACLTLNIPDPVSASNVLPYNNEKAQKGNDVNLTEKLTASGSFESTNNLSHPFNLHPCQASLTPLPHNGGSCALNVDNIKKHPGGIEQSFSSQAKLNLVENFSNLGFMPIVNSPNIGLNEVEGYDTIPSSGVGSFNKTYSYSDINSRIFHKGIICDGCGIHPIMGPRFKSKVKEDYDLCSICFSDLGNEAEYIRLDYPVSIPWLSKNFNYGCSRKIFDSRFVYDLNVVDGTVIAPGVLFTKKWRMFNNGATAWPYGLQLVWIGGDQLIDRVSVNLEIPADGVPVDKEIDIAVDFKAPEQPGRYISYWSMSLPSGTTFGQQIWVIIQVDASLLGSAYSFNLNEPPHTCTVETFPYEGAAEVINPKPVADERQNIIGDGLSVPFTPNVSTPVSNPGVDLSVVASEPSPGADTSAAVIDNASEQALLKELTDLNKEILRMNAYDLEQSVADLFGICGDSVIKRQAGNCC